MSVLRVSKRPRNDEHIITPTPCFETLRTAYNPEKHSILKAKSNGHAALRQKVTHTISP